MAGRGSRLFGRLADAFIPGNAYNSTTGRWNPATAKTGIAGMVADQFIPGGSNLVGMAANGGLFGSDFATQLRNEGIYNNIADSYAQTRNQAADYLGQQRVDIGGHPQVSVGMPQYLPEGWNAGQMPTMPQVEAQAPWQGLGTNTGNVLGGGALGAWANGGGQRSFGQAAGSFTPFGASVIGNGSWRNSNGALNMDAGEAARGFGVGMGSGGSAGGYALADAQRAARLNKV